MKHSIKTHLIILVVILGNFFPLSVYSQFPEVCGTCIYLNEYHEGKTIVRKLYDLTAIEAFVYENGMNYTEVYLINNGELIIEPVQHSIVAIKNALIEGGIERTGEQFFYATQYSLINKKFVTTFPKTGKIECVYNSYKLTRTYEKKAQSIFNNTNLHEITKETPNYKLAKAELEEIIKELYVILAEQYKKIGAYESFKTQCSNADALHKFLKNNPEKISLFLYESISSPELFSLDLPSYIVHRSKGKGLQKGDFRARLSKITAGRAAGKFKK
mgnify:FL=1